MGVDVFDKCTWKENTKGTRAGNVMLFLMERDSVPVSRDHKPVDEIIACPFGCEITNEVVVSVCEICNPESDILVVMEPSTLERSILLTQKHTRVRVRDNLGLMYRYSIPVSITK